MKPFSQGNASPLGATLYTNSVNFSLFAPFATQVELLLFATENDANPERYSLYKSYSYWHICIENCMENQLYGFRVYGEYNESLGHCFDSSKVLVDPYSKAIVGKKTRESASQFGVCNLHNCLKSVVINTEFDWEHVQSPTFGLQECIIYEMHPKGFTKHSTSKTNFSGTFQGILEKIPYLKSLGINTIELMPIFAFDAEDAPIGKQNFWGYSPIGFFALHSDYSNESSPQKQIIDFKNFVKKLHQNGFKIIVDVVFNHTTENDYENDPTYSFRGISNSSYYIIDEKGMYKNFTGCGNTLNANHSVVRRMIIQSLEYWVSDMHIDGFRFDLASVLSRDEEGNPMKNPPILWEIDSHPLLANAIVIAEPWDAFGLNQARNFAGDKWGIWNGEFRDSCRRFLKGDHGVLHEFVHQFLGSEGNSEGRHFKFSPKRNIHFITAHDGFTLHDLVSYNEKHNEENGENNRDGTAQNYSWNAGIEGETNDTHIIQLRNQQMKNAMVMVLLSHGVPMLLMGDEIQRTQFGNNNAYCIDEEKNYFDWNLLQKNNEHFRFVQKLISIRKRYRLFSAEDYFEEHATHSQKPTVKVYRTSVNAKTLDNNDLRVMIEFQYQKEHEHLLLLFNMHWEESEFELPSGDWNLLFDTARNKSNEERFQHHYLCTGRSIAMFSIVK